jgi:hypothetical protein
MVLLLFAIVLIALVQFWYLALGALVVFAAWRWTSWVREAQAREDRDRLRHARARQEIDRIAAATAQAMVDAARERGR